MTTAYSDHTDLPNTQRNPVAVNMQLLKKDAAHFSTAKSLYRQDNTFPFLGNYQN